jgi:hypothetical protein
MWMLFHRKAKTRVVRGGETFVQRCPECGLDARFHEVEVTEKFGVFFVDVVGDRQRAFLCSNCEEVFDAKDELPGDSRPALPSPQQLAREAKISEQERVAAERARREAVEAKAKQIDDELAALKKRMGR